MQSLANIYTHVIEREENLLHTLRDGLLEYGAHVWLPTLESDPLPFTLRIVVNVFKCPKKIKLRG